MKPHGLDLIMKEELLESEKVVHSSEEYKNNFEGWIKIINNKKNKYIELPMRSFVSIFLDRLHGILTGDKGTDTRLTTVSLASAASLMRHCGLVLGLGTTKPQLGDTAVESLASYGSLVNTTTTFIAPADDGGSPPIISSEVRRLISNNHTSAYYPSEIVLYGKGASSVASGAATGRLMFARDLIVDPLTTPFVFDAESDMRFDFKFNVTQGSTGGLNTNFSRLIHNVYFKKNPAPSTSLIRNWVNGGTAYTLATSAASTSFPYIQGVAAQIYYGIVIGYLNDNIVPHNGGGTPPSPDENQWTEIKNSGFTISANTVSATSSSGSVAKFSITRTFTNAGTSGVYINRVGILCRGSSAAGTALDNTQFLIANNTPTGGAITIQPNQTYRVTYTFQITV